MPAEANGWQAAEPEPEKVSIPDAVVANDELVAVADAMNFSVPLLAVANGESEAEPLLVKTVPIAPLPAAAIGCSAAEAEQANASMHDPLDAKG